MLRQKDSRKKKQQAERKRKDEQKRQKSQWFEDQAEERIKMLEAQLKEERQNRENLERRWADAQYDGTWDEEQDGWTAWHSEAEFKIPQKCRKWPKIA